MGTRISVCERLLLPFLRQVGVRQSQADFKAPTSGRFTHYFKPERGENATVWREGAVREALSALVIGPDSLEIARDRNPNECSPC
jgi:hypothetical protein